MLFFQTLTPLAQNEKVNMDAMYLVRTSYDDVDYIVDKKHWVPSSAQVVQGKTSSTAVYDDDISLVRPDYMARLRHPSLDTVEIQNRYKDVLSLLDGAIAVASSNADTKKQEDLTKTKELITSVLSSLNHSQSSESDKEVH